MTPVMSSLLWFAIVALSGCATSVTRPAAGGPVETMLFAIAHKANDTERLESRAKDAIKCDQGDRERCDLFASSFWNRYRDHPTVGPEARRESWKLWMRICDQGDPGGCRSAGETGDKVGASAAQQLAIFQKGCQLPQRSDLHPMDYHTDKHACCSEVARLLQSMGQEAEGAEIGQRANQDFGQFVNEFGAAVAQRQAGRDERREEQDYEHQDRYSDRGDDGNSLVRAIEDATQAPAFQAEMAMMNAANAAKARGDLLGAARIYQSGPGANVPTNAVGPDQGVGGYAGRSGGAGQAPAHESAGSEPRYTSRTDYPDVQGGEARKPQTQCNDRSACLSVTKRVRQGICGGEGLVATLRNTCSETIQCEICPFDQSGRRVDACHSETFGPGETNNGEFEGEWWCPPSPQNTRIERKCALKGDHYTSCVSLDPR